MKAHPARTEEHEAFRETMRRFVAERVYREVKVMTIGGGAEEIMKDLAARQLGWQ